MGFPEDLDMLLRLMCGIGAIALTGLTAGESLGQTWVCWAQWEGQCGESNHPTKFFACGSGGNSGFNPRFVCHQICDGEYGPDCRLTAGPGGSGGQCGYRIAEVECTDPRKNWQANYFRPDCRDNNGCNYNVSVGRVATVSEADALVKQMRNTYKEIDFQMWQTPILDWAILVGMGLSHNQAEELKKSLEKYSPKFDHLGFHKQADYNVRHGED